MPVTRFFAVVPAAGTGQRMQHHLPKQYLSLAGGYLADHTLSRLLSVERIERIVVALHPEDGYWSRLTHAKQSTVMTCQGGKTRADSVLAALIFLEQQLNASPYDRVLVHDMARPCVRVADIQKLLAADNEDGAILAAALVDTIKLAIAPSLATAADKIVVDKAAVEKNVANKAVIDKTLDRQQVWRALTPQLFPLGRLKQALLNAQQHNWTVTDEASAIELMGGHPRLVVGNADNIKVTHAADLALAEFYLQQQAKEQQS